LFLVITTILLSSPLTSVTAFADNNDDKKNKKHLNRCVPRKKEMNQTHCFVEPF
jgi:hypothetical protein